MTSMQYRAVIHLKELWLLSEAPIVVLFQKTIQILG